MAKKVTREQQYRDILAANGIMFEDCTVLAFVFEKLSGPEHFHFDLMEQKPAYFLFDCWGNNANIIIPKDGNNAARIIEIAKLNGGHKTTPDLR